jgi:hypothetical protein
MVYFIVCYCGGYVSTAWQTGDTVEQVLERWNTRAPEAKP